MEDVENQGSEVEAIAAPETETQHDTSIQESLRDTSQERNWRQLRRENSELKRQAELHAELLRTIASQNTAPKAPKEVEENYLDEIEREEYVPGPKVAKGIKRLKEEFKRDLEEVKNEYRLRAQNDAYSDLKREMPDLEDVVNHETLELVKKTNPRLAQTWVGKSDYEIYINAYPYIKNSGLLNQVSDERMSKEVDKRIEQNKKTVPSPHVNSKRPIVQLFDAARLSEERKQLFAEMNHYASRAGSVPFMG
jgi:hypothetical protein